MQRLFTLIPRRFSWLVAAILLSLAAGCPSQETDEETPASATGREADGGSLIAVAAITAAPRVVDVGPPSDYPLGKVEQKFKSEFGFFVVHAEYEGVPQVFALRALCPYLGGTPDWLESKQKFRCPLHGSGFYKDGVNFEGPAPRPLERYAIRIDDEGNLEVDTSRTFHEELGQWRDAASFVSTHDNGDDGPAPNESAAHSPDNSGVAERFQLGPNFEFPEGEEWEWARRAEARYRTEKRLREEMILECWLRKTRETYRAYREANRPAGNEFFLSVERAVRQEIPDANMAGLSRATKLAVSAAEPKDAFGAALWEIFHGSNRHAPRPAEAPEDREAEQLPPYYYILLIDTSVAPDNPERLKAAKRQAREIIDAAGKSYVGVGAKHVFGMVIWFDDDVPVVDGFTHNRDRLRIAVDDITTTESVPDILKVLQIASAGTKGEADLFVLSDVIDRSKLLRELDERRGNAAEDESSQLALDRLNFKHISSDGSPFDGTQRVDQSDEYTGSLHRFRSSQPKLASDAEIERYRQAFRACKTLNCVRQLQAQIEKTHGYVPSALGPTIIEMTRALFGRERP